MPPVTGTLPDKTKHLLSSLVAPKFEGYFSFTSQCLRSIPLPLAQQRFLYPDPSMISDLNFLWLVFADVYEIFREVHGKAGATTLANVIMHAPILKKQFVRILEGDHQAHDGEFWHTPKTGRLCQVRRDDAPNHLHEVLRTLRNGFAHAHWLYEDLTASDYWKKRGWKGKTPRAFDLENRPKNNYLTYIADARPPFKPDHFWDLKDLRILITPAPVLRYHLHAVLNVMLTGREIDIFGNPLL